MNTTAPLRIVIYKSAWPAVLDGMKCPIGPAPLRLLLCLLLPLAASCERPATRIPHLWSAKPRGGVTRAPELPAVVEEKENRSENGIVSPKQFILFNLAWPSGWDDFTTVSRQFPPVPGGSVRVGVSAIFSYLQQPRERTVQSLRRFLRRAQETLTPVVVQLDGENWWAARPDLWNWWDPARPGYSPNNRTNVEWTSWSPDDAIKLAWRNWGRQIRVLPPPNLMSERYRAACHAEMRVLIPIVLDWWRALPREKKFLFVGLKLGHESSIGVNAWYYPGGNRLLERPAREDPQTGLKPDDLPARGVEQIGYAAVKTAGLRDHGQITEADLAEVVGRHLEDLCRLAAELGVPRRKLFTHAGGWTDHELLYQAALNQFSCPGWSFYRYAGDLGKDAGVQQALRRSDARYWAAVEWLFQGPREVTAWKRALEKTLSPRCRYLCIFNWNGVRDSQAILEAVREVAGESGFSRAAHNVVPGPKAKSILKSQI